MNIVKFCIKYDYHIRSQHQPRATFDDYAINFTQSIAMTNVCGDISDTTREKKTHTTTTTELLARELCHDHPQLFLSF